MDEIMEWNRIGDERKLAILENVAQRKASEKHSISWMKKFGL
jgi:predicted Fe-S protein YdhL (DUF1289 family)